MKRTFLIIIAILVCIETVQGQRPNKQARFKQIEILGLKIYSREALISACRLGTFPVGRQCIREVIKRIDAFYIARGYALARTYLMNETASSLSVYVDEGRLGKIIFLNLNAIDTLKMRYLFDLKHKIYNTAHVDRETQKIKKKYHFKDVQIVIRPLSVYQNSFFQLDRGLDIPILGNTQIPFIEKYGQRFDLEVHLIPERGKDRVAITYGFRTSYTLGIIPYVGYTYPSLFAPGDRLKVGSSLGIFYGFDLKFGNPPDWTFMEANSTYQSRPFFDNFFTPKMTASIYRSRAARSDIGLTTYEYLKLNTTFLPGLLFLDSLHLYGGYGLEQVFMYRSEEKPGSLIHAENNDRAEYWNYYELQSSLKFIPWSFIKPVRRSLDTFYRYYFNKRTFHEFSFKGRLDFEFSNLTIYNLGIDYQHLWNRPPFYHEIPVSTAGFKGFMGKGYYTRDTVKLANEYRISVYKDFIYVGPFADFIWFEGSGYDLHGNQFGIVGGVGGHVIILDQFEFTIYYGKDYLFSSKQSQYNLTFSLSKKW